MTDAVPEDVYAAQRAELLVLLKDLFDRHESLRVHEKTRLNPDDIASVLQKIKNGHHFSRRESGALVDAGFRLDKLFPRLL
jgi:TFIIF-interacting CTD phosphatase-like protein